MWGGGAHKATSKQFFALRQSADLSSQGCHQRLRKSLALGVSSPREMRRDLKTAGGVGLVKLEGELLAKDIVYKADMGV